MPTTTTQSRARQIPTAVRALADQAFSRAAGAPLIEGNFIRLLIDGRENYPAWLSAIAGARRHVHFENYIFHDDETGRIFADALMERARAGIPVRLIYDWMGAFGKTSRSFWNEMREAGVDIRCYNPPRWDSPFGWLSRNHRKNIAVDGRVAFVTGLCIGKMWVGEPEKNLEPWRDTGVEVRGPSVADVEQAFADVWAMMGEPLPPEEVPARDAIPPAGTAALRIIATLPATAGTFRVDQLVAALARKRLWLTDAYFAGVSAYVQALRAAAMDGVDVRLLVPSSTDIPLLKPLSRSGYRPLLEAGVRVFEWNGSMLHAKTAVADGRWARVGSTNLNISSWLANCELDVVAEDIDFARQLEAAYERDLENATEIVLEARPRGAWRSRFSRSSGDPAASAGRAPGHAAGTAHHAHGVRRGPRRVYPGHGSVPRAAAGAMRLGNAVRAAFTSSRVLESGEDRLMLIAGAVLLLLSAVFFLLPRLVAWPTGVVLVWFAVALLYRGIRERRAAAARRKAAQSSGTGEPPAGTVDAVTDEEQAAGRMSPDSAGAAAGANEPIAVEPGIRA